MSARHLMYMVMVGTGLIGCSSGQQSFKPAEKIGGETVEGFKEAFYDMATDGQRFGEVKVWSRGATTGEHAGMQMTLIHLGFTIENKGDVPIELDADSVELESVQTEDRTFEGVKQVARMGPTVVAPKTTENIELTFALPKDISPAKIRAFRVRWTANANGEEYTEFTPFVQQQEQRYAYVPVYGYYYPYHPFDYPFYGPFYPGHRVIIVQQYPRRVIVRGHRRTR